MYDQIRDDTLFGMLYAVVSALFLVACFYLLFRQGNAFARDVTPPVHLRRWYCNAMRESRRPPSFQEVSRKSCASGLFLLFARHGHNLTGASPERCLIEACAQLKTRWLRRRWGRRRSADTTLCGRNSVDHLLPC